MIMRRDNSSVALMAIGLLIMTLAGQCSGQLRVGFYDGKCKTSDVEEVIFWVVKAAFDKDPTLVAAMLRMLFHDCFVRGCDASILIDGTGTEKTASPNKTVRGYELIDAAKAAVEKICPGVVSCADIIVIVTRHTVYLSNGHWYDVETGRRDGRTSRASDASSTLPAPDVPVPTAVTLFGPSKNLTKEDFVLLMGGGHTVGIAHCGNFQNRMYSYKGVQGNSDPTINPIFIQELKGRCPSNGDGSGFAKLDRLTPVDVDNAYYQDIVAGKGVLQIDQDMARHTLTSSIVARLAANPSEFIFKFPLALNKMARIGVLVGTQGEIRTSCRAIKR